MKPTILTNPFTGEQCYTKHPEKLIARWESAQNHVDRQWEEHQTYWNGSAGSSKMHRPGEVRS